MTPDAHAVRQLDEYIRECIDDDAWPTAEQIMHIVNSSAGSACARPGCGLEEGIVCSRPDCPRGAAREAMTECTTWGCSNRAESMVSCEGEGVFPYCRECADLLISDGEERVGAVDDPVVSERDRYREAIEKAMRHLGKVPCDAQGKELCAACEAQITLCDALEYRDAA